MANTSLVVGLGVTTVASSASITVVGSSKIPWSMSMFDSSEVTHKYQQFPCIGKLFKNVDWTIPSDNNSLETKVKSVKLNTTGATGCISVRWEKDYHKDNDWRGNWNVLWGMTDNTHGTIFVSTLVSGKWQKTIDGVFYVLKKEGDKWKVIGKKGSEKQTISSLEDNLIIKPGNTLDKPRYGWCFSSGFNTDAECSKNRAQLIWNYTTGEPTGTNVSASTANSWGDDITNHWIGSAGRFGIDFTKIYEGSKGYYKPETN